MTAQYVVTYSDANSRLEIPGAGNSYSFNRAAHFEQAVTVDSTVDGRDLAADGSKVDYLTVTGAVNLDTINTKVSYITITGAVDLDTINARVNALDAAVVLMGSHDASTLVFPTSTVAGESWIISVAGTIDGVVFEIGDRVVALIDSAPNSVYAGNWLKLDYTDLVSSVAGKTGVVTLVEADITDLQSYLLATDIDSVAKVNAYVGDTLLTTAGIDTLTELNAIVGDTNVLGADGSVALDEYLDFTPVASPTHVEGRVFYDNVSKTLCYYTDDTNVTNNIGEELWIRVINNSGSLISDGTPVAIDGAASGFPEIVKATPDSHTIGVVTADIANGAQGYVTEFGIINGLNLSAFSIGDEVYVDPTTPGGLTATVPAWPNNVTEIGHVIDNDAVNGKLMVHVENNGNINLLTKAYTFSARTAASGVYYLGGFYNAPAADTNLSNASPTQTLGTANHPYSAHAFMVFGAGSTDGTNITITVTGTSIDDAGNRTAADSEVLYNGTVAALTLDDYLETTKKWIGQVTYTLTSDGTAFTCDFNYGFAKYEDFSNIDFTVIGFEATGLCNTADPGFEVEAIHHKETGWTYSAAAFVAGPAPINKLTTDLVTESDLAAGEQFAWKRANLSEAVSGAGMEGTIFRITTTVNNSISYLNINLTVQV